MPNQTLKVSNNGLAVTTWAEGFKAKAYPDPGSKNGYPWTIGRGHTKGVKPGDVCTVAQADAWLIEDMADAASIVKRLVTVDLTQGQFDALCDFVFNIGEPQFKASTLLRMVNRGQFAQAGQQFERWKFNDGKPMLGLLRRRIACKALWEGRSGLDAVKLGEGIKTL